MNRLIRLASLSILISMIAFPTIAVAQIPDGFQPDPDKFDLMVVVAHPDDESTFGGLIAYYATCRNMKVKFISLTSGEWGSGLPHHASADDTPDYSYDDSDYPRFPKIPADALYPSYYREGELSRMLLMSGVDYKPIMPRFKDMSGLQPWGSTDPAFELWRGQDKVVGFVVQQMRRCRPDVVVTMAVNGYNGNPEHMAASRAAVLAVDASGSADQYTNAAAFIEDPHAQSPASSLPPWTPKKLYVAVNDDESYDIEHIHHWELDCGNHPGNSRILAARANALHESQEMKEECPESTRFHLLNSNVGPDVINQDNLFENVD
ncbi:1D-myo-inositol 2-acetamido-2-deoxy-alpha-D-glucopyranoside deacetylase [Rubripirellula tenax]|uniref:1D-myo-inositol 2-acetamido-2-deoxy-alpha-D-glucopyranoside deacetylase n=1 Tax=Rubripirellula tenax TaxID=2528015 RepID=A0A5C6FDE0_9BACT|nr:PIG-L family deacetylase [Rubripirellula tenax]TWU58667.1 1D-myo-inositol 2-acetamido-2-deoxy-alpha-D-glucopyranoside deacetylase [Rubripirellula tenax]